jgi:hypothetical protein
MTDSKGDYYPDDFLEVDSVIDNDASFENLVDNFDRDPEIDERREMRESLQ